MLRSRLNKDTQQSNKVKIQVGSYVYDYDLLTLKVYDENDREWPVQALFEQILKNQSDIEVNKELFSRELTTTNIIITNLTAVVLKLKEDKEALELRVKSLEDTRDENDSIIVE